jgi:hypothetical protein
MEINPEEKFLLQAALLERDGAISAWQKWREGVSIQNIDPCSRRLLPLLHQNLRRHRIEDSALGLFKGVHRSTWVKNQKLIHEIVPVLKSFQITGIPTLLLKGASLLIHHYQDYGLRYLGDFDILVHVDKAAAAYELLTEYGWIPAHTPFKTYSGRYFHVRSGIHFQDESKQQIDLHWHILSQCCTKKADDDFWGDAKSTEFHGVSTYILSPTDQLFHTCVHGVLRGVDPSITWIADAMIILNTSESEIDWERLVFHAKKHRLFLQLKEALTCIRDILNAPVPKTILKQLQESKVSRTERLEYRVRTRPPGQLGGLPDMWFNFLRSSQLGRKKSLRPEFFGFMRYLQYRFLLDHLWQVPLTILSKTLNWLKLIFRSGFGFGPS